MALALLLLLGLVQGALSGPYFLDPKFTPDIGPMEDLRRPAEAEPQSRFDLDAVQRFAGELGGGSSSARAPAFAEMGSSIRQNGRMNRVRGSKSASAFLEAAAEAAARRPLQPVKEMDPFGNEVVEDRKMTVPAVSVTNSRVFSAPSFSEVMSHLEGVMKAPHPDPRLADHHQPMFNHHVVAQPSLLPPPMPPSPPANGAWTNPPVLKQHAGAAFHTAALISVREDARRKNAAAAAAARQHAAPSSGRQVPRMAPPPPLPGNHPRSNAARRPRAAAPRRSSYSGTQVPSFVQLKSTAQVHAKAKTQTKTQTKQRVVASADVYRLRRASSLAPVARRMASLPPMPLVGAPSDRSERRFD